MKKQINDIDYTYEFIGDPKNPGLVLIAGYTMARDSWGGVVDLLKQHFYLLIFDNQGMPETVEKTQDSLSVEILADNIVSLYTALGMKRPGIMGFALGSTVAQTIAYKFPSRVHYLILVSSVTSWGKLALDICEQLCQYRENEDFIAYGRLIFETCFSQSFKQETDEREFIEEFAKARSTSQTLAGQKRQLAAFYGFNSKPWASKILTPTLVLSPQEDIFSTPQDGRRLAELMPNATQVVLEGGHAILGENPSPVAEAVKVFYQKLVSDTE